MDTVIEWIQENNRIVLVGGVVVVSLLALRRVFFRRVGGPKDVLKQKQFPRNVVVLVQMRRGSLVPSPSPFVLKVETYLRMANIPYENVFGIFKSTKDKFPFILYNEKEIADSQFIIEFLNKEKSVDLNQLLTTKQKAISRAFLKMTEENLFWTLVAERWVYSSVEYMNSVSPVFNRLSAWVFKRHFKKQLWGHGIGRHSREELRAIMDKDMRALSHYLDDKKFFFGDQPSEIDCSLFGQLAQYMWQDTDLPQAKLMKGELQNLARYCERMRERFWPDWDECITHNFTRKATK